MSLKHSLISVTVAMAMICGSLARAEAPILAGQGTSQPSCVIPPYQTASGQCAYCSVMIDPTGQVITACETSACAYSGGVGPWLSTGGAPPLILGD